MVLAWTGWCSLLPTNKTSPLPRSPSASCYFCQIPWIVSCLAVSVRLSIIGHQPSAVPPLHLQAATAPISRHRLTLLHHHKPGDEDEDDEDDEEDCRLSDFRSFWLTLSSFRPVSLFHPFAPIIALSDYRIRRELLA